MMNLDQEVVVVGQDGHLFFDPLDWIALCQFLCAEPDRYGNISPCDEWILQLSSAMTDDDRLPLQLTTEQAVMFADNLEFYSSGIPDRQDVGRLLNPECIYTHDEGKHKRFAVTSKRGWIEADEVDLIFLEKGKDMIFDLARLCRQGTVTVDLASRFTSPREYHKQGCLKLTRKSAT